MTSSSGWEEERRHRLHDILKVEAAELNAREAAGGAVEGGEPDPWTAAAVSTLTALSAPPG